MKKVSQNFDPQIPEPFSFDDPLYLLARFKGYCDISKTSREESEKEHFEKTEGIKEDKV